MTEAAYSGKLSNAWFEAAEFTQMIEWSFTGSADTSDSSVTHATLFGKTRTVGYKGGTATVKCYAGGDFVIDKGDEGTLELLRSKTNTDGGYSGEVICTNVAQTTENATEVVTYSFLFNGTISNSVTKGS